MALLATSTRTFGHLWPVASSLAVPALRAPGRMQKTPSQKLGSERDTNARTIGRPFADRFSSHAYRKQVGQKTQLWRLRVWIWLGKNWLINYRSCRFWYQKTLAIYINFPINKICLDVVWWTCKRHSCSIASCLKRATRNTSRPAEATGILHVLEKTLDGKRIMMG